MYSIYYSWTIDEGQDIGGLYYAYAIGTRDYPCLTKNKRYVVEITPRILPMTPLCVLVADDGLLHECRLERFEKIEKIVRPSREVCVHLTLRNWDNGKNSSVSFIKSHDQSNTPLSHSNNCARFFGMLLAYANLVPTLIRYANSTL